MTSTLILARRHVTFSMSPESDETFYMYTVSQEAVQDSPRADLATLRAKGGGSEYVDKLVFQVGTDFHKVSEYRVT